MMVRQRQRKTIEELYGNKFDATKSQVTTTNNGNLKNGRTTERDYGYVITSNTPYIKSGPPPSLANNMAAGTCSNVGKETYRRKNTRPLLKTTGYQTGKEKNTCNMEEDAKKVHNMKMKTSRAEAYSASDNKSFVEYNNPRHKDTHAAGDNNPQAQNYPHYQHHHNHHNNQHRNVQHDDEDKDDTEEFFQLIRQTVESAVGKSISELLNRNFRELSTKVEQLSAELMSTNALLNKIQTDMNNKIVHYGEENSSHFRYLCMKSEYDKMFYQHQTMIASAPVPTAATPNPSKPKKRKSLPKIIISQDCDESSVPAPCSCRSTASKTLSSGEIKEPHKVSSGEISQESSESGMRAILQKFYKQMHLDDLKCGPTDSSGMLNNENFINYFGKEILAADDNDISDSSSDEETPRSDHTYKCGNITRRTSNRGLDNCGGGGDA